MRWQFKVIIALVVGFAALDLLTSPSTGQVFQFGQAGGLFGKSDSPDPVSLLRNPQIKKELRLTEQQSSKVDEAVWKALAEVLDPDQYRRLKQIDRQQRDYKAFADTDVQADLKLSDDQKKDIKVILADSEKEVNALTKEVTTGALGIQGLQALPERISAIRKDAKDRCTEILTNDQRRTWQELVGDTFVMEQPKIDFGNMFKDFKGLDKKGQKKGKG